MTPRSYGRETGEMLQRTETTGGSFKETPSLKTSCCANDDDDDEDDYDDDDDDDDAAVLLMMND